MLINDHVLPAELCEAIDSGKWPTLKKPAAELLGEITDEQSDKPAELYTYEQMAGTTHQLLHPDAEDYWIGSNRYPLDPALVADPTKSVTVGEQYHYSDAPVILDYRSDPPCVRVLTNKGWKLVADTIGELIDQLTAGPE